MRVLLGMPHYSGQVSLAAATAFYHPIGHESKLSARLMDAGGSLLACSFNQLWAAALDRYEAGEIDGFAMQHSDIAPEQYWLDILHDEMTKAGADVISAVVPIKDDRGLVSTAVDDTGDPWLVRRLTMHQVVNELPPTFGEEDVGGPLLLNTGLWLCRLGPWAYDVCFTIRDVIRVENGKRRARVEPEDWNFSRQCRAAGLKLVATRAVKLRHFGDQFFPNDQVWGWEEDLQNGPKAKQKGVSPGFEIDLPNEELVTA